MMDCLIITPHRFGIPEMAQRVGDEWNSLGHNVEYILADGAASHVGPITIGAPGIAVWWYRKLKQVAYNHDQYDLIWTHQPIMPYLPTSDESFWNKVILTIHTTLSREYELTLEGVYPLKLLPYYWFVKTVESRFHRMVTNLECAGPHYTVVSPHLRDEIRQFGVNNMTYIPNGIFTPDQDSYDSIRNEYNIPSNATLVFNIGSLTIQKQADLFAQKMRRVVERIDDTYIVMAGDGPLRNKIEQYASESFRPLGYIGEEQKWRWFADADIFASLSAYEGMPVATVEALSFNLPLILSDIPSHQHIVEKYNPTAKLVNNDINSITDTIKEMNCKRSDVNLPDWSDIAIKYITTLE